MFFLTFAFLLGMLDGLWSPPRTGQWSGKVVLGQALARVIWCGALGVLAGQLGAWSVEAAFLLGLGRQVLFIPGGMLALVAVGWLGWRWHFHRLRPSTARTGHPFAVVVRVSSLLVAALTLAATTWEVRQAAVTLLCFAFGALPFEVAWSLFPDAKQLVRWRPLSASIAVGLTAFAALVLVMAGLGYDVFTGRSLGDDLDHLGHVVSNDDATIAIGAPVPDVVFRGLDGQPVRLSQYRGKVVVLAAVGTRCPCVEAYRARLNALASDYAAQGVVFLGFNPNANESVAEIVARQAAKPFVFPVVVDEACQAADTLGATCMTECFLVDAQGRLQYHGRIDDNTYHPERVTVHLLRDALEAVLAGKPVNVLCRPAIGCAIVRKKPGPLNAADSVSTTGNVSATSKE
ncbi:MAG: redoxin domain-containing protein [Chloracidobacterium sp.]|uniref:Redoxin domain-containing protein n=1 Tax=Chloracidobacterium validum TaxID=2821543 RepID=A0ABX8BAG4_9BACT|nr:redoxin domain-containing protein [Chloracidobacterium validum]QUW02540.1 redoxin domain-containing protein [Chloracidobacterium validum]